MALNFRSPLKALSHSAEQLSSEAQRIKLIDIGKDRQTAIALILNIRPKDAQEFDISLTVFNSQTSEFLPKGLEMIIMDGDNYPVMIAQANETETIEFCFSGKLGEHFSMELAFGRISPNRKLYYLIKIIF